MWRFKCKLGLRQDDCGMYKLDKTSRGYGRWVDVHPASIESLLTQTQPVQRKNMQRLSVCPKGLKKSEPKAGVRFSARIVRFSALTACWRLVAPV
jgi:hypothetical protein